MLHAFDVSSKVDPAIYFFTHFLQLLHNLKRKYFIDRFDFFRYVIVTIFLSELRHCFKWERICNPFW